MALGGGTFTLMNKVLPGSYINFISKARANVNASSRGYVAFGLDLDWGVDGEVFEVTSDDFKKNSLKIFGYAYDHEKLKPIRDLFINAKTLYAYKLNTTGGVKATCTFGTARYTGVRGNDLKIIIQKNVDEQTKFDVIAYFGNVQIDKQIALTTSAELKDNDYIVYDKEAVLAVNAGVNFTTGKNGTIDGSSHKAFLTAIESYYFNIIGCASNEETIKKLYASFCQRLRDEFGVKFQTVIYNYAGDYEGIINVMNKCTDDSASEANLVYFVSGIEAGCEINKSCTNKVYNGEYIVDTTHTQSQLETAVKSGKLAFHRVGKEIRILEDINSLVTTTDEKGEVFKVNQTIRVCDQIGNDIASLFNSKYLGNVPNDAEGRISLWADIVKHHEQLRDIRAIENFSDKDVTVEQGNTKKQVMIIDNITVINTMEQLYMTVIVG